MNQPYQKLISKKWGGYKVSKRSSLDHADRGHYDSTAPTLQKIAEKRASTLKGSDSKAAKGAKATKARKKADVDDDAEIVEMESTRRSGRDGREYPGRRAAVIAGKKIVGVLG